MVDHNEIDTTVLKFAGAIPNATALSLSAKAIPCGLAESNQGYALRRASVKVRWVGSDIAPYAFDLRPSICAGYGSVLDCSVTTITGQDIKLNNIKVIKLSYGRLKGMSGGPLVIQGTTQVVGLMSYGLPPDLPYKHNLFAVSADEIIRRL